MLDPRQFGLNPRPFSLVPEAETKFWAGMPETKRSLADVMASVRRDDVGSSEFVLLHGVYGSGKSHGLRYFARETAANDSISIYVENILATPRPTFSALGSRISSGLDSDTTRRLVRHVKDAIQVCVSDTREESKIEVEEPAVVRMVVPHDDQETVNHILTKSELPSLDLKDDYEVVRRLASIFRIATSRIGEQNEPAFQAAYLFLDEVEALAEHPAPVQTAFFASVRGLINAVPSYCGLVLSFTMGTAVLEAVVPTYLWERLTRPTIEVDQLSDDEAERFVREYLENVRPDGFTPSQPYYPFSKDALLLIFEHADAVVPRRILSRMRRVWERVARRDIVSPGEEISREDAEDILAEVI